MKTRARVVFGVVVGGLVLMGVFLVLRGVAGEAKGDPMLVCIDATESTDAQRDEYLPEIETVARQGARERASFFADVCGDNAIGTVNWPVHKQFEVDDSLQGANASNYAKHQVSTLSPGLEELVESGSSEGTPLGEMLLVAAQKCRQEGGHCAIYMFTDGEWADERLRVKDGVTETELEDYIDFYESRLGDLPETVVHFVGVGYDTDLPPGWYEDAREAAEALVHATGARVGTWGVSL